MQGLNGTGTASKAFRVGLTVAIAGLCLLAIGFAAAEANAAKLAKPGDFNSGRLGIAKSYKQKDVSVGVYRHWSKKKHFDVVHAMAKHRQTLYSVKGKRNYTDLNTKWKGAGKAKFKFKPVVQERAIFKISAPNCNKKTLKIKGFVQFGPLKGKLALKGERGFIKAKDDLKRVVGYREMVNLPACAFKSDSDAHPWEEGQIFLGGLNRRESIWLNSKPNFKWKSADVNSVQVDRRGKTEIYRTVFQPGAKFRYDRPAMLWAELDARKGPMIKGNMRFDREPGWLKGDLTGNIRVNYIGNPNYRLPLSKMPGELWGHDWTPLSGGRFAAPPSISAPAGVDVEAPVVPWTAELAE